MSLRFFHIFFIITASALAVFGGAWTLSNRQPVHWAALWFGLSACLDIYLVWFIRKSREIRP